jgi:hypothetical protein
MRRLHSGQARAAVALAAVLVAGLIGASAYAGTSTTFTDETGDNPGGAAPDVTHTIVSIDDGTIRLEVETPNRQSLAPTDGITVYLNTDLDGTTGEAGSDYRIEAYGGAAGVALSRWTGSAWVPAGVASFTASFSGGIDARFRASDLGIDAGFSFFVYSAADNQDADYAPSNATAGGRYTFDPTADVDGDGVIAVDDDCPTKPAGSFDPNANGCPGPFESIEPVFRRTTIFSGGLTRFESPRFIGLPAGAKAVAKRGSRRETLTANADGVARSRLLDGTFAPGTVFTVLITKKNWIGYSARLIVTSQGPGIKVTQKRCTPPSGSSRPRSCAGIDDGS